MILKILKIWKAKPHVKVACLKITTFQFCIENNRFEAKKRPFFFFFFFLKRNIGGEESGSNNLAQIDSNPCIYKIWQWCDSSTEVHDKDTMCIYCNTSLYVHTRKNAYINAKKKCVYTQTQRKNAWISTHKEKMRVLICTLKKIYIYIFFLFLVNSFRTSFLPVFCLTSILYSRLVRTVISILSDHKKGLNRWFASAVTILPPSYSFLKTLIPM